MLHVTTKGKNTETPGQDSGAGQSRLKRPNARLRIRKLSLYIGGALASITLGHYLLPETYHVAHNVLQRLYYIPIIWAAYRHGKGGGMVVATISGVLYLPHAIFGWQTHPEYQINQIIEVALFLAAGTSAGYLFEQHQLNQRQLQSYEKMAFFGNLSRSIIRSLKGPLRAVRGMLVALEPVKMRDPAAASCLQVIQDEVTRIEAVRNDLISLVERKNLRLKKQNLNALMFDFVSQIEPGLGIKGIRVRRMAEEVRLMAHFNRRALVNILHQLVGSVVDNNRQISEMTFYTGRSSSRVWLGATIGRQLWLGDYQNGIAVLSSQHYHDYDLIPVINIMNNHFGDVKYRWQDNRLVEFVLIFPRKLKLPWHLKDESINTNKPKAKTLGSRGDRGSPPTDSKIDTLS